MTSSVRFMISAGAALGLVLLAMAVSGISALAGPLETAAPGPPRPPSVEVERVSSPRDCPPPLDRARL